MARPRGRLIRFARARTDEASAARLLAALPTPMLALAPDGTVADANPAAELLLNHGRLAMIGRSLAGLIGPVPALAADPPLAAYDVEVELAGRRCRVDLMVASVADRAGWRVLTIHERAPRHLVDRRQEARAAVGAAAMLAHEIKNPLSGIRGAAQLLESGADEAGRALTGLIRGEVDRVAALIDRMEDFTDTRPPALEPQNIHAVLGHVRDVARRGFAVDVAIREAYDPSLPAVLGDRDRLIQVFMNLVKNAAEAVAGQPDGCVTLTSAYRHGVAAAGEGGRRTLPIEVCVLDNGPGAPPELVDHLFEPFVTRRPGGSGLGLALVAKLVDDLGGAVAYAREGGRTVFRVLLPRAGQ